MVAFTQDDWLQVPQWMASATGAGVVPGRETAARLVEQEGPARGLMAGGTNAAARSNATGAAAGGAAGAAAAGTAKASELTSNSEARINSVVLAFIPFTSFWSDGGSLTFAAFTIASARRPQKEVKPPRAAGPA
jgi:hypothetical protein